MSLRRDLRGARQGVSSYSVPVSVGIQYRSGMPLPLNQKTKRGVIALAAPPGAAYAVPFDVNQAARGGRPTLIAAPAMPTPRRNRRLLTCMLSSPPTTISLRRIVANE